ncbi:dTDP-4-amino-4,6-dideoxygalactose transaminase [Micromonospora echinospora]|uniref:dTDP-4-amino-4,6-dideoxygalactose transaminase n=1 Tax=Micromonospora echinospora TaxID=1877 RepID=A0A1C5A5A6_MICEC|nr:aminotransferase class V-fold PLP-dependent enzyme [Micromonospora echinospora]SCF40336.1 dTDP-4-amino-4,6-dideoxygalactose transaminase [Micromonospora echinospora]
MSQTLAIRGGEPSVVTDLDSTVFRWPIMDGASEARVLGVLRSRNLDGSGEVAAFEREFADYCGAEYAVGQTNGTSAVLAALWAVGVRRDTEVIVPATTYWASAVPAQSLGARVVFADIQPTTLTLDPADVARKITSRTRAVVAVHLLGHPADMAELRELADARGVAIVEDASHAHGSTYRGVRTGALGDVAAFSFHGKPIAAGEGGIVVTPHREVFERVLAWGQNFRLNSAEVSDPALLQFEGLPMGGVTSRLHPVSAALAREQLTSLDERMAEVEQAMQYFWDGLTGIPFLLAHRPPKGDRTMGAWYQPHGIYRAEAAQGLSANGFMRAIRAEGFPSHARNIIREPLHRHPLFGTDVLDEERWATVDARPAAGPLPNAERVKAFGVPPFKRFDKAVIDRYVEAYRKVADAYEDLLADDPGDGDGDGGSGSGNG